MELLTEEIKSRLLENGRVSAERIEKGLETISFRPVVKLFTPTGRCVWLLSELDPEDADTAFCLADLGLGNTEVGSVSIAELAALRDKTGLSVERDLRFEATQTLGAYAAEARKLGYIKA